MKTLRILLVMILTFALPSAYSQKVKTYNVWVTLTDDTQLRGYLYSADASALVIKREDFTKQTILPETISVLKLRRENSLGKGAWIGALGGLVLGAAAGYAAESGSGWEDVTAIGGGIIGVPIGALIGVGVGSFKKNFDINGDRALYLSRLPELQKYAPQKNANN